MSALAEHNPSRGVTVRNVALTGNPNCGKTTLFNALTGLRAKVGNYAGVTVERKEGRLLGSSKENPITVLDLPGTYSLSPQSLDEQIARDVLFHRLPDVPPPDLVVVVVDASNLQRNLYFATQVIELGYPTIIALNMIDVARENGHEINTELLARELGVPVLPLVASKGEGIGEVRERILLGLHAPSVPRRFAQLPPAFAKEMDSLASVLARGISRARCPGAGGSRLILSDERFLTSSAGRYPERVREEIRLSRGAPRESRHRLAQHRHRSPIRAPRRNPARRHNRNSGRRRHLKRQAGSCAHAQSLGADHLHADHDG